MDQKPEGLRPGIDIIVVNYRTPNDLRGFIASFEESRPTVPFSLVIVNVDPLEEDERAAWSCNLPFDYTQFLTNVGYASAVNYASTFGDRETIAIFNADTRFMEDVATACHYALQSHSDWGIVGPRQIDNKGLITHGGFLPQERGFHHPNGEEYGDIRPEASTVSGSAYFIKRTVWDELTECPTYRKTVPGVDGAFLPTPLYYEETWCSYHARAHGHKVVYYGPATMVHNWTPPGEYARKQIPLSRDLFHKACNDHGIDYV